MARFPEHMNEFIDVDEDAPLDELSTRYIKPFSKAYTTASAPEIVRQYIRSELPAGRLVLYAASTQTAALLPVVRERTDVELVGILDINHRRLKNFHGVRVLSPLWGARDDIDHVFVNHPVYQENMVATLIEFGVPAGKIHTVNGTEIVGGMVSDSFRAFAREATIKTVKGSNYRNCIVSTLRAPWSIIPSSELAGILPPENTLHLAFTTHEWEMESFRDDIYEGFNTNGSFQTLMLALEHIDPEFLYLKLSPHSRSEYLVTILRHKFPEVKIVVELYDMGALFSEHYMRVDIGNSYESWQASLIGNLTTARETSAVISKAGGASWDRLSSSFTAKPVTYYPLLPSSIPPDMDCPALSAPQLDGGKRGMPVRVVYAGSMRSKELTDGPETTPGENFIRYFETMASSGKIEVDIFNAAHRDASLDAHINFSPLVQRYGSKDGAIRYHRSLPLEELGARLKAFDFGFACAHYPGDRVENVSRCGIGNRFMGYVMAGLPIIVDSYFEHMSELVSRHGAGIVVDPEEMESLPRLIEKADLHALQKGVRSLRNYMIDCNGQALRELKEIALAI